MRDLVVGKFKGKKTLHAFDGWKHQNPICKQEDWRPFPRVAIVVPLNNPEITCPKCRKLIYGE